jgi:hypothetical protein
MPEIPVVCQMTSLNSGERERREKIVKKLSRALDNVNELENGYAFRYSLEVVTWMEIAEFIDLEHQCCPFFAFDIKLQPQGKYVC